jgi:transcriptional regulator with XRE-family HTH domain
VDWVRVGVTVRALRIRTSLTQARLAARARVPRDAVSAIERGRIDEVRLAELDRVVAALGASLDVRIRWRGEQLDRLLDEAHALTVAATVERLSRLGWATAIEVSFSIWGERGSIDVLAWHAATRTVLVIEVKSVLADIQSLLHGLDRKTRLAPQIAAERGWYPESVARLVVIAESPTSRGRVKRHAALIDAALPARGRELRAWLGAPAGPMSGLLFLSNAAHGRSATPIWRRERARRPSTPPGPAESSAQRPSSELDKDSIGELEVGPPAAD